MIIQDRLQEVVWKKFLLKKEQQEWQSDYSKGAKKLKTISIPDSVKTIDEGAFSGAKGLSEVRLSSSLERIEASAFF